MQLIEFSHMTNMADAENKRNFIVSTAVGILMQLTVSLAHTHTHTRINELCNMSSHLVP